MSPYSTVVLVYWLPLRPKRKELKVSQKKMEQIERDLDSCRWANIKCVCVLGWMAIYLFYSHARSDLMAISHLCFINSCSLPILWYFDDSLQHTYVHSWVKGHLYISCFLYPLPQTSADMWAGQVCPASRRPAGTYIHTNMPYPGILPLCIISVRK